MASGEMPNAIAACSGSIFLRGVLVIASYLSLVGHSSLTVSGYAAMQSINVTKVEQAVSSQVTKCHVSR